MLGLHLYSPEEKLDQIKEIGNKTNNVDLVDLAVSMQKESIYIVTAEKIDSIYLDFEHKYDHLNKDQKYNLAKNYVDTLLEIGLIDSNVFDKLNRDCEYILY